jgi:hypothetical protein
MCISFLVSDYTAIQLYKVNPGLQILLSLKNIETRGELHPSELFPLSLKLYLPLGVDIFELE